MAASVGFFLSSADLMKADLLTVTVGSATPARPEVPAGVTTVATDSYYYPQLRGQYHIVNYEMMHICYWPKYLARSQSYVLYNHKYDTHRPHIPQFVLISAATVRAFGPPDSDRYDAVQCPDNVARLGLLGLTVQAPGEPYAIYAYRLKTP